MTKILQFVPKRHIEAAKNLVEFIRLCKNDLTVFGAELKWEENYWITPGITFGNLNQKNTPIRPYQNHAATISRFCKSILSLSTRT